MRNDRLGTLVSELVRSYQEAGSWEAFASAFRGRSYLSENLDNIEHPAADLPRKWRDEGVPAQSSSPPWTVEQKDECVRRGCHPSASLHASFLREEMAEFIENKFWAVLPYELVRELEDLFLSPAAVKEERDRKPRLLCNHSWPWPWGSINETTTPHAPPEAMQFGGALPRLLYLVRHQNPKCGPLKGAKHDIKDGFYRLFLRVRDCLHLALLLPRCEGEPPLIAIPMACTMGWVQSPPTFCTMSETVCDLANASFQQGNYKVQPHRLSAEMAAMDDVSRSVQPRPKPNEDDEANEAMAKEAGTAPGPPDEGRAVCSTIEQAPG